MNTIRWTICDDAEYLRTSFKLELENQRNLEFVGDAHDSKSCVKMVAAQKPDILLLDIQMDTETAGIDIIPELKKIAPAMKIIMLTSYDDENYVFSAFANGADDYIYKSLSKAEIVSSIINVYNNTSMLRPEIAKKLTKRSLEIENQHKSLIYIVNIMTKLSTSEFEVLKSAYNGDSYKKIAAERFVDISTVRTLASRVLRKFNTNNMQHLIQELSSLKVFELFDK